MHAKLLLSSIFVNSTPSNLDLFKVLAQVTMGPVSIGVEVQQNTDEDTPSTPSTVDDDIATVIHYRDTK